METLRATITIEAPEWALKGGFPEDMAETQVTDLPEGATIVEPYVVDSSNDMECAIYEKDGQTYKVDIREKE